MTGSGDPKTSLRAVMYQDGERWIAVCLEHYILALSDNPSDLVEQLMQAVEGSLVISSEKGVAPFEGIPRSPQRYWDLYDRAQPLDRQHHRPHPGQMPSLELRTGDLELAA